MVCAEILLALFDPPFLVQPVSLISRMQKAVQTTVSPATNFEKFEWVNKGCSSISVIQSSIALPKEDHRHSHISCMAVSSGAWQRFRLTCALPAGYLPTE